MNSRPFYKKTCFFLKAIAVFAVFLFSLNPLTAQVPLYVPTNGLIGAWTFSGSAADVSGTGNNGTVFGATLIPDRCGNINSAYDFDGVNDYIQMLTAGPTGSVSRTIAFWMKTSNNTIFVPLSSMDWGSANAVGDCYEVVWNYCAAGVGLDLSNQANIKGSNCMLNNAWHHIALVYDATVSTVYNNVSIYVDGFLQTTVCNVSGLTQTINTGLTYAITVGAGGCSGPKVRFWIGGLDDIYLYNRALSLAEVQQLIVTCPPAINGSTLVCPNAVLVYSISPITNATYTWTLPGGWSGSSSSNSISATSGVNPGVITLSVTNPCGLMTTSTLQVNVGAAVTATGSSICAGQTMSLTATASVSSTYTWTGPNSFYSTSQNNYVPNASPAMSGIYTVTTNGNPGCGNPSTVNVLVTAIPVPGFTLNPPFCAGGPFNLFASPNGVSYAWSGPSGFSSALQNPVINPTTVNNSGVYNLTVSINSCSATLTSTLITINPTPTVSVSNGSNCAGQSIAINSNASAGVTYSWTGPNSFTAISPNVLILNSNPSMSGPYLLQVTFASGCTNTAISNHTVVPIPSTALFSNQPRCAGSNLSFTTQGGSTYTLTGPNNFFSTSVNPVITAVDLSTSGNYTLIAANSTCTLSNMASVVINPTPAITAGNTGPVCAPDSFTLNGMSAVSNYTWSGPNNFLSYIQNPSIAASNTLQSGIYTVSVTGTNGCIASATTPFTANSRPIASATGATVCAGQSASMNSGGGGTYAWTGPAGYISASQIATLANTSAGSAGQYTVTVSGTNGCAANATANLAINPLPIPLFTVTPRICFNSQIHLQASGGTSYLWKGPANFTSSLQNTGLTAGNLAYAGTYTLIVFNGTGCSVSVTTNVIVDQLPSVQMIGLSSACTPFCSDYKFVSNGTAPVDTVVWFVNDLQVPQNQFNYCFYKTGKYTLTAKLSNSLNCRRTSSFEVTAYKPPVADFENYPLKPIEKFESVTFTSNSAGANPLAFDWYIRDVNGYGFYNNNKEFSYLFETAGIYPVALVVTDARGCKDTVLKTITINEDFTLYVPDAFTPDGDNLNDVFLAKGRGIRDFQMWIYDRWGEKIYESSDALQGWDGSFKNKECKTDTYIWKIALTTVKGEKKEFTGHIILYK